MASPPSSSHAPPLPAKPSTLTSVVNRTASNYSPYPAASRYNPSPYGGIGGYSSPYSRFGGMGSSMYGGMGGMGGMGGYGSMYGGMGGMYGGMGGFNGQPGMGEDPNSLTNAFSQSTQATFQIIESIVGAFGGFAQMLESTYMATHSSFFGKSSPIVRSQSFTPPPTPLSLSFSLSLSLQTLSSTLPSKRFASPSTPNPPNPSN